MGLIERKTWSQMINEEIPEVIPKTTITTTPGGVSQRESMFRN